MKNTVLTIKSTLLLLLAVSFTNISAQAPNKMSYQAVVRDANNSLVKNQAVGVQVSILQGNVTGTSVYSETHTPSTNDNGLFSIEIGGGSSSDDFSSIDWSNGPYFIKSETDPTGGTNYTITGVSQIMSVPYALHAKTVEIESDTTHWKESGNDIYYNEGKVGVGMIPNKDLSVQGDAYFGSPSGSELFIGDPNWHSSIKDTLLGFGSSMILRTQGSNRLTIAGNGRVGIGTTNPITKLHINNDVVGSDSSVFISSMGNIVLGTSSQLNTPNALTIYRSMGSNTLSPGQHNAQIRILNTNGNKALVIGSLDDGRGFIQANEVNVGYQPLLLNPVSGNVGIGSENPSTKLHVRGGDTYMSTANTGVILTSPNGSCFRLTVDNSGSIISTPITCP